MNHNEIGRIPYENSSRTGLRNLCAASKVSFLKSTLIIIISLQNLLLIVDTLFASLSQDTARMAVAGCLGALCPFMPDEDITELLIENLLGKKNNTCN